jgi:hypothetical protein
MAVAVARETLSLDVGSKLEAPDVSSFKVRGAIDSLHRELYADDDVQVIILGADGEVIVSCYGVVRGVGFKKHVPAKSRPFVERIHTIALTQGE